jgi:cob(I)alamin adenosyltransferase
VSIVTKKGDKGKTSLFLGGIVSKDNPRVEVNGALDELSCFLGMAKCLIRKRPVQKSLEAVQKDLIVINAEVATSPRFLKKLKKRIGKREVARLEKDIEGLEAKEPIKNFCFSLSGKNLVSSCLDVSRTIARRTERRTVTLSKKNLLKNPLILVYLNRLSDLLYLLARRSEKR